MKEEKKENSLQKKSFKDFFIESFFLLFRRNNSSPKQQSESRNKIKIKSADKKENYQKKQSRLSSSDQCLISSDDSDNLSFSSLEISFKKSYK